MISYEPLWTTMKQKNISQYSLIRNYKISSGQIDRLRKNSNVSTYTLNRLCEILECGLHEIAVFVPEDSEQPKNLS